MISKLLFASLLTITLVILLVDAAPLFKRPGWVVEQQKTACIKHKKELRQKCFDESAKEKNPVKYYMSIEDCKEKFENAKKGCDDCETQQPQNGGCTTE